MRDTTVRQPRVPHTFDALAEDFNMPVPYLQEVFSNHRENPELGKGLVMFELFLNGQTYEAIGIVFNMTSYKVNRDIHRAYKWLRQSCQSQE